MRICECVSIRCALSQREPCEYVCVCAAIGFVLSPIELCMCLCAGVCFALSYNEPCACLCVYW